ncbi:MAG: hypothetical protein JNK02_14785 [Planctomycetes bacterium]|nr:hypothetical protein [Planctomycetota bacterium]
MARRVHLVLHLKSPDPHAPGRSERPGAASGRVLLAAALLTTPSFAQAFRPGLEAPGASGGVYALAAHDDGGGPALFAGGEFEAAGAVLASRIARWRLGQWSPLSAGLDGRVAALLSFDEDGPGPAAPRLFAGGEFERAGALPARRVARWDGLQWTPLGPGFDGPVAAFATFDDDGPGPRPRALYAAGSFTLSGALSVNGVARWNGVAWEPLGSGLDAPATSLATFDPDGPLGPAPEELVAGGFFERAGGLLVNGVARWNGSVWAPLASGVAGSESAPSVQALATFDPDGAGPIPPRLFLGGSFTTAGNTTASGVASWDGAAFASLQTGVAAAGSFPALRAFATFDDGSGPQLVATGLLRSAGGVNAVVDAFDAQPLLGVARWNGAAWSALGPPAASTVNAIGRALAVVDDDMDGVPSLFVAGFFARSGPLGAACVAKWTGAGWAPLGGGRGLDDAVRALAAESAAPSAPVVAGGAFVAAGTLLVNRVALWDDLGAQWAPLGAGFDGDVHAVHVAGGVVHAGGDFLGSAGTPLARLARWTGAAWTDVGGGTDGSVLALASWQGSLAVGGAFRRAGGLATGPVALWTGASWVALPNGPDAAVRALLPFDDGQGLRLWAAGDLTRAGGAGASGVARWDGAQWLPAGGGLCCGSVHALAVHDAGAGPTLYAGGDFDLDGDGRADGVARWDPLAQAWIAVTLGLAGGRAPTVRALASWSGTAPASLVAGGDFGAVSGVPAANLARLQAGVWSAFGTGADGAVEALLARPGVPGSAALLVGGAFTVIDGRHSARLARSN